MTCNASTGRDPSRLARAVALAAAVASQRREQEHPSAPTLGWVYLTDHYGPHAMALLAELRRRWPEVEWIGATGVGIAAGGVEYFDEPALSLLLADLPRDRFRVFSGAAPLRTFNASTAQVHADPATAELADLIRDMSARTTTGYLFGGLASARSMPVHLANVVLSGGLSGVAFGPAVDVVSRVTQGCQPFGPLRKVSAVDGNVVTALDGEPPRLPAARSEAWRRRSARHLAAAARDFVGLSDPNDALADGSQSARRGAFGSGDARAPRSASTSLAAASRSATAPSRHAPRVCSRNVAAARRDLMRICAEIRRRPSPKRCRSRRRGAEDAGPGEPAPAHTGRRRDLRQLRRTRRSALRRAVGPLAIVAPCPRRRPLAGFLRPGEIARHHVYGYTGVDGVPQRGLKRRRKPGYLTADSRLRPDSAARRGVPSTPAEGAPRSVPESRATAGRRPSRSAGSRRRSRSGRPRRRRRAPWPGLPRCAAECRGARTARSRCAARPLRGRRDPAC
jgi:hypothetical protein